MKRAILSSLIILFVTTNLFAQQKKIEFVQYSNLTYSNNELFAEYTINQKVQDSTIIITKRYKLPDSLTTRFLDMIDSSNILSVSSNNNVVIDGIPFRLKYKPVNSSLTVISGHYTGMTDIERNILNHFTSLISPYTNYNYTIFRESLPDGEYYSNRGMTTSRSLEIKENGIWENVANPLYILNGKIISLKTFKELKLETDNYKIQTLTTPESTAIYGTQAAAHGVIIITNK